LHTILLYCKPYLKRFIAGLTVKFTGTITDLLIPWILAYIVDHVVPLRSIPMICVWGAVMIVCSILTVTLNIVANRMASGVARDVTRNIRHDLFVKTSALSCAQIDKITIPSLVARLSSDTYNIHRMISMMQRLGVRAPILVLGGIIITLTLEPRLTLILLAILPVAFFVIYLISRKGIPLYTKLQVAVDVLVRVVRENATGIRIIKALSKGEYEKARFAKANADVTGRELKANIIMGITNPAMFIIINHSQQHLTHNLYTLHYMDQSITRLHIVAGREMAQLTHVWKIQNP